MHKESVDILQKYWGFDHFRPKQQEVIQAILDKKDSLTLFPTGGGKSLCFQVPAMIMDGICIVVSPLISLMEDQVQGLQEKNIKAMAITGGISYADLDRQLDNCIFGNFKFLYLSPERLQQELVRERIKQMNVNLIAVDEAHCISQWGHDFRPAYRNISEIREILPNVPFAAFTATATNIVAEDIVKQLELKNATILKVSIVRENLGYEVVRTEDKFFRLSQIIEKDSAIIYVRSRNATVEITAFLKKNGINAAAYHGGMKKEVKTKYFNSWRINELQVMVATTAFGMGIDKPDVRTVIHVDLPESLESYFQEAGRAGRDGLYSRAIILTNESDIPVLKNQFLNNLPTVEDVKLVYKKLNAYFRIAYGEGDETEHDFNFSHFCHQYQLASGKTFNALQILDRCSILKLSQNFQRKTEIQILISANQIDYFIDNNPKYSELLRVILRNYGGVFDNLIPVNLNAIAEKSSLSEKKIITHFEELQKQQIIEINISKHDATIIFLVPREDDISINPFSDFIKQYNLSKKAKIDAVLEFVYNDEICKQNQLLVYFGEKPGKPCGKCSVCKKENKKLSKTDMNEIFLGIRKAIGNNAKTSREITSNLNYSEKSVLKVLGLLCEKGVIKRTPDNKYKNVS